LRRVLGPVSVACVGVGAAIGSGIFATPGEAARHVHSPWLILLLWGVAGFITLLQTLVTAELATRLPHAGGEYQYLKAAYGRFAAFFFGWSFTLFIVGGGAGTIAALFGDFCAELFGLRGAWAAPALGCAAVGVVVGVNAAGLRTGAATQSILTLIKTAALVAIAAGAAAVAGRVTPAPAPAEAGTLGEATLGSFLLALFPVFWSYTGATDSAKMAEETRDVHRALPLALCGSAVLLTAVYLLYNYALLCAASPAEMAGHRSVPSLIFTRAGVSFMGDLLLGASALVCLGALSSTLLANVRVPYALSRDGLAPAVFGRMSEGQAPVAALGLGGGLACAFVVNRGFEAILRIYFLASAVLFGLTYLSLVIFRLRDRRTGQTFPAEAFRLPLGIPIALALVALEGGLAVKIIHADVTGGGRDSLYTLLLLGATAAAYRLWRRPPG
jgi:APA family basic amino acid/polyamine antiporter